MKTHTAYLTIIAALIALLWIAAPYAKKGYDQTVLEEYGATITAKLGDLK